MTTQTSNNTPSTTPPDNNATSNNTPSTTPPDDNVASGDNDDTLATAKPVGKDSNTSGTIGSTSDVDYYRFVLRQRGDINISVDTNVAKDLLDSNGDSLESDSNGTTDINQTLEAGTYYVKIGANGSTTGDYKLKLSYIADDIHGSIPTRATIIEPNSTTYGTLGRDGDIDWLKLTTTSRGRLRLTYTGSTNIYLKLKDDHMKPISEINGTNIDIETGIIDAGTYHIVVTTNNSGSLGEYNITSSFVSVPEHGNDKATATGIELDSTTLGDLTAGDEDWFELNVTRRGTLTVYTTGSTNTKGYLTVLSGDRSQSETNDDNGSDQNFRIIVESLQPGIYYVNVQGSTSEVFGSYTLFSEFTPN